MRALRGTSYLKENFHRDGGNLHLFGLNVNYFFKNVIYLKSFLFVKEIVAVVEIKSWYRQ